METIEEGPYNPLRCGRCGVVHDDKWSLLRHFKRTNRPCQPYFRDVGLRYAARRGSRTSSSPHATGGQRRIRNESISRASRSWGSSKSTLPTYSVCFLKSLESFEKSKNTLDGQKVVKKWSKSGQKVVKKWSRTYVGSGTSKKARVF